MTDRPVAAVTPRELLFVAAALGLAIALLALLGGGVLWTRPYWLDEICCTLYPVIDASSPLEVISRIASPKDYAPPLLHLIVWSVGRLTGGITPVVLRSISLFCVSAALIFVYATLRRRFDRAPSAAGALAVASHVLVLTHAFEGRFYGPWLLFAAGFAWSLSIGRPRVRVAAQAVLSVLLVTIHWFGVLSLGLMCFGALASYGRRWREGLRLIAPSAVGLIVLLACMPMLISQRATSNGVLWVAGLSAAQVGVMLRLFALSTVPMLAAVLLVVDGLRDAALQPSAMTNVRAALRDPSLAALTSLALMPLVLIGVSVVLQPSLLDRYAIVTVLWWAPLVALGVATLGRGGRALVALFLALMVVLGVRRTIAERREFARSVADNVAAFQRAKSMNLPIVFQSLLAVYPVAGLRPADPRALFLDMPDSTIAAIVPQPRLEWLRRNLRIERDIARSHAYHYAFPTMVTQARLDSTPRFLFIASDESLPRLYTRVDLFAKAAFPNHRVTRLTSNLALLER
jgi:hypothetical protein